MYTLQLWINNTTLVHTIIYMYGIILYTNPTCQETLHCFPYNLADPLNRLLALDIYKDEFLLSVSHYFKLIIIWDFAKRQRHWVFFFFSVRLCWFCVVIRFFHPRDLPQLDSTLPIGYQGRGIEYSRNVLF